MIHDLTSDGYFQTFDREQREPIDAVPTPFPKLNKCLNGDGGREGVARGWFVVVGGNPGFGKSLVAMNFAAAAMQLSGERVGYVSLEMTAREIAQRVYAIALNRNVKDFERDGYDATALHGMRGLPGFLVPREIRQRWHEVIEVFHAMYEEGCRYFVLDYLQLVQAGNEKSIYEAISEVVTYLRGWALNHGCVLICLSQFNRETSRDYKSKPVSQSLWGGMMLEASSDLVILLDHSRYEKLPHGARTWLLLDKNRHGPRLEIPVAWDYRTLKVREALPHEEGEWG